MRCGCGPEGAIVREGRAQSVDPGGSARCGGGDVVVRGRVSVLGSGGVGSVQWWWR